MLLRRRPCDCGGLRCSACFPPQYRFGIVAIGCLFSLYLSPPLSQMFVYIPRFFVFIPRYVHPSPFDWTCDHEVPLP